MELQLYKRGFDDDLVVLKQKLAETTLLLEVLANVNALIGTTKNFEAFCMEVTKILQGKFKYKYIHIWIRDEKDAGMLRLVTPETVGGSRNVEISRGIVGKAIRENRTICVPDVTADPDYLNVHQETKSELTIPLRYDGKIVGAINIETDAQQSFINHLVILELIANNLGHSMKLAFLYQTEEYFHRLVEHMSEGVWVCDFKEQTIYTNPALQKMTGFNEHELRGTISYDYFDETSQKIIRMENEKRIRGESGHYEATLISQSGEKIPVIVHGVPFGSGGSMATITDLRAVKTAERKLLETERFLASITQYCQEAIVGINENDVVQSWNVGAERMFGFKASEMIGKSVHSIIPEDRLAAGESIQIIHETVNKGSVRNFETVRLHKNGKPITISLTCSSMRDNKGNIMGLSVMYRDITAQKKWERELQDRFEKMQEAYKEMGRQRRYLDYLMDMINMAQSGSHTKKQISTFIVNAMVMITRVDAATLRLLDSEHGKLLLTAQSGLGEDWWTKKAISYSHSLLERAVSKGSPIKILDILSDPDYTSPALARKNNLRSALVIPLEAKGELLGSLTLYLSHEGNLSLLDDEFIGIFAKQAAIALKLAS